MATCYSYMRYSSLAQSSGDSVRRQTNYRNAWLGRHPQHSLDDTLVDSGISGFRGRNASQGALADFLKAIEAGKIGKGSILLIESIDRLGRQTIDDMMQLVRKILLADVAIITLAPERELYKKDLNDLVKIIELLLIASRAREESERKSDRSISNWDKKRHDAIEKNIPIGGYRPSWLDWLDGKFVPNASKVLVVKRIFGMVVEGKGIAAITRLLNKEKIPVIGYRKNSKTWGVATVARILKNRAVLGEYSPHLARGAKRTPTGDILPNYYPRIISDELFHKVGGIMAQRDNGGTYVSSKVNNLFAGLLYAPNGSSWFFNTKQPKYTRLECKSDKDGLSSYGSIRYPLFEEVILSFVKNWGIEKPERTNPLADKITATQAELETTSSRLVKLQTIIEQSDAPETYQKAVVSQEKRRKELKAELDHLQQEAVIQRDNALEQTQTLLTTSTDRQLIRQALANTIERITIDTEKVGRFVHFSTVIKLRGWDVSAHVDSITYTQLQKQRKRYWEKRKKPEV